MSISVLVDPIGAYTQVVGKFAHGHHWRRFLEFYIGLHLEILSATGYKTWPLRHSLKVLTLITPVPAFVIRSDMDSNSLKKAHSFAVDAESSNSYLM